MSYNCHYVENIIIVNMIIYMIVDIVESVIIVIPKIPMNFRYVLNSSIIVFICRKCIIFIFTFYLFFKV